MDLPKFPLEKIFYFAAGVIPGFVALLIFQLAVPGSFGWFFTLGFLGYRTKLSLILLTAFIIGNSMTTFLNALLGAAGGAYGTWSARRQAYQPPNSYDIAPWRDQRWRVALRKRLGAQAPNDTLLLKEQLFNLRRESINFLPEAQRPSALAGLNLEKIESEMDDGKWAGWYEQYHHVILTRRPRWDAQAYVQQGLSFNLETAAVYALASMPLVPGLRHWWCIVPASMWTLILAAQQYTSVLHYKDKWSTLTEQIEYLSQDEGTEKAPNG